MCAAIEAETTHPQVGDMIEARSEDGVWAAARVTSSETVRGQPTFGVAWLGGRRGVGLALVRQVRRLGEQWD